jgi:hypothetical protein
MQASPGFSVLARQAPTRRVSMAAPVMRPALEVSSNPPTWAELPSTRRRRLVTVLGTLVQRSRKEAEDDDAECRGGHSDGAGLGVGW